jgi:hypothetical protein
MGNINHMTDTGNRRTMYVVAEKDKQNCAFLVFEYHNREDMNTPENDRHTS